MKSIYTRAAHSQRTRLHSVVPRFALPALLAASLALVGCQPHKPGSAGEAYTTEQILVQRANDMLQRATAENSVARQALLLDAAETLIQAQQSTRAQRVLQQVDQSLLTLKPLARYNLMQAELALAEDNFFAARGYLTHPAMEQMWRDLPVDLKRRWHGHRADLFALLGEEQRSVEEYVALSTTLDDSETITNIHQRLWQLLTRIPQNTLLSLLDTEQQRVLRGWYLLADVSRSNQGDIEGLQTAIEEWQRQWSWHPGALHPPEGLNEIRQIANQLPQQLALLLPLSGSKSNANAAKAIQSGFMAAYYQVLGKGSKPPVIRVYDTATEPDIQALYNRAITEGAEMVIGPVTRKNVAELNEMGNLPVPTISLTYLQDPFTPVAENLLQFGLSTTNEARQVAQRAWLEGHRRALAIVPDIDLGRRTLAAFRDEWETLGGEWVSDLSYEYEQIDFKESIKSALLIDQSELRARRLADVLGKRLKSAPQHRRQDIDMIFILSTGKKGRLIKPVLDFYHADNLPVYSTSLIYSGKTEPNKNRDLDNIKFCAMSWMLPGTIANNMIPDTDLNAKFFALGLDAYKIHQGILQMRLLPNTQLFGSTGTLKLDNKQVVRQQPWAEFRGGKVRRAQIPKGES